MKTRGFTLIELMIVVAIIGILASVALPSYQVYTTRSQIVESLVIVGELKSTVAEHYKQTGEFPADNAAAGLPKAELLLGNYVSNIKLTDGAFHVRLGNKVNAALDGKIVTIRPIVVPDSPTSPFSWVCGLASIPDGMQAIGENLTDVDKAVLPGPCRI